MEPPPPPPTLLNTFRHAAPAYAYAPIPPPGASGHAASAWPIDAPIATVRVSLLTASDASASVALDDAASGCRFADAPLPGPGSPGRPYAAVVDAAIDSSRNFALRVVDAATGRAATLGLGFHERDDAGAFVAALGDADAVRRRAGRAAGTAAAAAAAAPVDRSLQGSVRLAVPGLGGGGGGGGLTSRAVAVGEGGGLLPPPPRAGGRRGGGAAPPADAGGDEDDEWGEFQ